MSALSPTSGTLALAIALGAWLAFHELPAPPSKASSPPAQAIDAQRLEAIILPPPPAAEPPLPPTDPQSSPASPAPQLPSPSSPPALAAPAPAASAPPIAQGAASGRLLLRQLEQGKGPAIDIAWPVDVRQRQSLHERLLRCYGMKLAVLDREGRLFDAESAPGKPWEINLDRYSGFVRQVDGFLVAKDGALADLIRARHRLPADAMLVSLFPRAVDAALLAGLSRISGYDYDAAKSIRAAYAFAGRKVAVETVQVDGFSFEGAVVLPVVASGCG
jgi:hypothetical protein